MNFTEIKQVIIDRAKNADACADQFRRAVEAETMPELLKVITDNFTWCCDHKIIDIELLSKIEVPLLDEARLYFNRDVSDGYCLVLDAEVRASGNAEMLAFGNAKVEAFGNATVEAFGNATVRAWDNATVLAFGNATVRAWGNATVRAWGNATVEASGNATVRASGNATVRASGNAFTLSYNSIEHESEGNSIIRWVETNRVVFGGEILKP